MIYGSWDMECNRQNFLSFWAIFCPFTLLKLQNIKISKKWKKSLAISSFYARAWKILIIFNTVLEIWGMKDVIFIFILGYFLSFYPPNNPENQHLEKMKKISGDIIILHMRVINDNQMMCGSWDNQMMCGSWDMERNRQNFLSIRTIFCPFTLLTSQKIKFWKNEKNKTKKQQLEILPFYTCVP